MNSRMKKGIEFFAAALCAAAIAASTYGAPKKTPEKEIIADVPYCAPTADEYTQEACKLDLYIPKGQKGFPTLVWFHGGGITAGNKQDGPTKELIASMNFAVVSVNYRLSPKIKAHEALEDAADAIAWVFKNIEKYGGDKNKIFVGGHSAGAYLSGMTGFAPKYLQARGIKNTDIAGMILLSGQVTTHFRVRKDLGDNSPQFAPKIDELSMLGNVANKIAPLCLIVGDRRIEFKERVEENFLLESCVRTLKTSPRVEIYELQGLDHGTVAYAAAPIAQGFIKRVEADAKNAKSATHPEGKPAEK